MPQNNKKRGGVLRALSFCTQTGFSIAACVCIGVFAGKWIDSRLHTSPYFLLGFSLLGMAAAFWSIIIMTKKK